LRRGNRASTVDVARRLGALLDEQGSTDAARVYRQALQVAPDDRDLLREVVARPRAGSFAERGERRAGGGRRGRRDRHVGTGDELACIAAGAVAAFAIVGRDRSGDGAACACRRFLPAGSVAAGLQRCRQGQRESDRRVAPTPGHHRKKLRSFGTTTPSDTTM
ncbi:MAG TPA: hypothetical protein VFS49_03330, partial [Croceibacterium sp.]|nr:hypothetical protein [Croceibacterium sp.]